MSGRSPSPGRRRTISSACRAVAGGGVEVAQAERRLRRRQERLRGDDGERVREQGAQGQRAPGVLDGLRAQAEVHGDAAGPGEHQRAGPVGAVAAVGDDGRRAARRTSPPPTSRRARPRSTPARTGPSRRAGRCPPSSAASWASTNRSSARSRSPSSRSASASVWQHRRAQRARRVTARPTPRARRAASAPCPGAPRSRPGTRASPRRCCRRTGCRTGRRLRDRGPPLGARRLADQREDERCVRGDRREGADVVRLLEPRHPPVDGVDAAAGPGLLRPVEDEPRELRDVAGRGARARSPGPGTSASAYQRAARRCSSGTSAGSLRCSSALSRSRRRGWHRKRSPSRSDRLR